MIESALDVKRPQRATRCPGYGWIFPVGDGSVNIGVGLLSTFRDFKSVNTTHLLDELTHQVAERWEIDARDLTARPVSGRIPMGGSVGPEGRADATSWSATPPARSTPSTARASTTPTRPAAWPPTLLHEALVDRNPLVLAAVPQARSTTSTAQYFKVARLFAQIIGRPALMRELTRVGDAQPDADGVGAAHHGQPPPPGRARPGRSRYSAAAALAHLPPTPDFHRGAPGPGPAARPLSAIGSAPPALALVVGGRRTSPQATR